LKSGKRHEGLQASAKLKRVEKTEKGKELLREREDVRDIEKSTGKKEAGPYSRNEND